MEVAATSSLPSPSLWSSLNGWFTSTVFFILLNLMIATILFTSNLPNNNQPPQEQQQDNSDDDKQKETKKQKQPSILTRLKSFTFEHNHHDEDDDVNHHAQPIEVAATQYVFNQPMHYQHFDLDQPSENITTHYDFNAKYSGEVVSGADEFSGKFSGEVQDFEIEDTLLDSEPTHEEILGDNDLEDEVQSMDDVYSKLVDSKKSTKMKKSKSLKVGFKEGYDDDVAAVEARRPETVRMKKTVRMLEDDDDDDDDDEDDDGVEVDSRADYFINKFKNDLKLQRIESMMKKNGKSSEKP